MFKNLLHSFIYYVNIYVKNNSSINNADQRYNTEYRKQLTGAAQ